MTLAFRFNVWKRELEAFATGNRTKTTRLHLFLTMICKAEKKRFPSFFEEGGGGYYFLDSCNCNRVISIVGPMIRCRLYPVSHHSLSPNSLFSKLFFDFSNILKEPITIKMAKRVLIFQGFLPKN